MEEGDIASSFVKDLGLALAPKMCPDQLQAFKEVNNSQGIYRRKKKNDPFFFWTSFLDEPLPGAPRHVCTEFRANIRRADYVGPILSQI